MREFGQRQQQEVPQVAMVNCVCIRHVDRAEHVCFIQEAKDAFDVLHAADRLRRRLPHFLQLTSGTGDLVIARAVDACHC